jgi:oligosaccharide repeat unit polymerase
MRILNRSIVNLGIFSLGVSYLLYSFMQYFFTPICWWLAQHFESLSWMNEIFVFYDLQDLYVFTSESITYSFVGVVAFFFGYKLLPEKLARTHKTVFIHSWSLDRAEQVFWILFIAGFSLKMLKILTGIDVRSAIFVERGILSNPTALFLLSLNWFHLIGFVVINIVYQEAKLIGHASLRRLKTLAYSISIFVIAASLVGGSRMATLSPVLALLIINRYYSIRRVSLLKLLLWLVMVVIAIFFIQYMLLEIAKTDNSSYAESGNFLFNFFYILFHRVNMSYVVAAVLEKGQQAYPDGTLGQFWVDMAPYGMEKINIFDGNEFGRAMGLISPQDTITGVASTNMGELFINFGFFGIVFGMLMMGILYKLFSSNCQQRFPFSVMLYALMWPILIHGMESPITVLYVVSIKMIALCLLVHLAIIMKLSRLPSQNKFTSNRSE